MKNIISKIFRKVRNKLTSSPLVYFLSRKTSPLSKIYGFDRGIPIDRYYIDKFLDQNKEHINGTCLEIQDNYYTRNIGHASRIDIADINRKNKKATIYTDLRDAKNIEDNTYDCIVLTQVLQFIDDYEKAIGECKRILKPGGFLLATVPCFSRMDVASGAENDFWRWTPAGAKYAFSKYFENNNLEIKGWGNVLTGLGFWIGMAQKDLDIKKFEYYDQNFPVLVSIKAKK